MKMKAIVMGSYYYINELAAMGITGMNLGHTVTQLESTVRCLGVILDSKINWKAQTATMPYLGLGSILNNSAENFSLIRLEFSGYSSIHRYADRWILIVDEIGARRFSQKLFDSFII